MVKYGMTQENLTLIAEKAKLKNDGVYDFRGVTYAVKGHRVVFYAHGDDVVQPCYGFLVNIGKIADNITKKTALKTLLKRENY